MQAFHNCGLFGVHQKLNDCQQFWSDDSGIESSAIVTELLNLPSFEVTVGSGETNPLSNEYVIPKMLSRENTEFSFHLGDMWQCWVHDPLPVFSTCLWNLSFW